MKLFKIYLCGAILSALLSCGKDSGLDSPLDPNGNNWHPPVVTVVTASKDSATIKDSVTITASATDNGTIIKYAWSKNGTVFTDTTGAGSLKTAFPDSGRHVVFVKAMDNDNVWSALDSCVIYVTLGLPTVKLSAGATVITNNSVVITASAIDNGTITKYIWTWMENYVWVSDTTAVCSLKVAFTNSGRNVVKAKVMDNDGFLSLPDSSVWTVPYSAPPILTSHHDTTVGQNMSVEIHVAAVDTNHGGSIQKYFWDLGANGWDDSTTIPQKTISFPSGGPLPIIWAARNNAGVLSRQDMFTINFNRPPQTPLVSAPLGKMRWDHFNFTTNKGVLPLLLSAIDPDSSNKDTLTFTLSLGASMSALTDAYSGKAKLFNAPDLDTSATIYWRLKVKDLYGDSAIATGSFVTPPPSPPGMVFITGGTFQMGQTDVEDPVHRVTVSSFWMDTTEVRQADYLALMGTNPSQFRSDTTKLPVEKVSWFDAARYCNARSKQGGLDTVYSGTALDADFSKNGYRLPTDAQWEYACRAGGATDFYWGVDTATATIAQYAWYSNNAASSTHIVAQKTKNAFGLFDMSGNVGEWCNDWYGNYTADSLTNPTGPSSSTDKVIRGGNWKDDASRLRCAFRASRAPEYVGSEVGFRVVLPKR